MENPSIRAAGGEVQNVDQVVRLMQFANRHPEVTMTSPRENGTFRWRADWLTVSADPKQDGQPDFEARIELRDLLDYLEARFDR
jgi:hypothetical protein